MIRKATSEDHAEVEAIMQQVHRLHVEWRPDVYASAEVVLPKEVFAEMLKNENALCFEEQGRVIGVALFMVREVSGGNKVPKRTLFVDTVAVLEEHRGKGVGHALFDELKSIAKERNCEGVELQVNARNQKAMKMYRDYGFNEKSINMELCF